MWLNKTNADTTSNKRPSEYSTTATTTTPRNGGAFAIRFVSLTPHRIARCKRMEAYKFQKMLHAENGYLALKHIISTNIFLVKCYRWTHLSRTSISRYRQNMRCVYTYGKTDFDNKFTGSERTRDTSREGGDRIRVLGLPWKMFLFRLNWEFHIRSAVPFYQFKQLMSSSIIRQDYFSMWIQWTKQIHFLYILWNKLTDSHRMGLAYE